MKDIQQYRQAEYEVDPMFINRWSPRSFTDQPVPDDVLFSLLEAARWAPSGSNVQPWRFIIARSEEDRKRFYSFIAPGNRIWCEKAPVLVLILSRTLNNQDEPLGSHAFDAGAAWGFLALQALKKGLITHAMAGFSAEQARRELKVPEEYDLHAVIAIGFQGEKEQLPEAYQEREVPSDRRPLSESLFEGRFGQAIG